MDQNALKRILPIVVFLLLLIPIVTSSLLDWEQGKANELILEQERLQKEAEQKIYLTGKFDPTQREDFVLIPSLYTRGPGKMYMRKEALEAYLAMEQKAKKDGIELRIASATRNFDYQKELWNKKWSGTTLVDNQDLSESIQSGEDRFEKILEYSATPGISRHHWGTEIDINAATPEYFETATGKKVYEWLAVNAPSFGFCQTYNKKDEIRKTGYNEEKWHWSYLPLAKNFLQEYKNLIKEEDIKGFFGDAYAINFDLINDYVLSINPDCL